LAPRREISPAEARALAPGDRLNMLVERLMEAVTFDVREFFAPSGSFVSPRSIPRELSLLVKGVKLGRTQYNRLANEEYLDLVGAPTAEVSELRWTSQADLLLRAIEVLTAALDRQRRHGEPLSDSEVERGALKFLAARRPDLAAKYPDLFAKEEKP
jgi:hypothetical protein